MYTLLNVAVLLAAVPLVLVLVFSCYLVYVHRIYSHIPGPPIDSFFLGNLPKLLEVYRKGECFHILFLKWAKQYGPVYRVFVLHDCLIFLSSPNAIKEVLTRSRYPKSSAVYSRLYSVCGVRFLGCGLVTLRDHRKWQKKRAIVKPAFHKRVLSGMMDRFNEIADQWLVQLEPFSSSQSYVDMTEYFGRVTLDVIGKVAFDTNFHALDDAKSPFLQALWEILKGFSAQIRDPLLRFRLSKRHFVRNVQHAVKVVRSEGQRILRNHQTRKEMEHLPDNVLNCIVKYKDLLEDVSDEDLLDEFCTMLIAGQETTANLLSFLLRELGNHPHVLQRILEEMNQVLNGRKYVTYDDINRLEYLGQAIRETLRMYPPATGTVRQSVDNTVINGYHIPSETQLIVSFFVVHRIPEYFPDPDCFKPERFDPDAKRKLYTYMPFSIGQRSCIGQHLFMIEAKVLLCKFFEKFTFELDPLQPNGFQDTATLRPKGGVRTRLLPRDYKLD